MSILKFEHRTPRNLQEMYDYMLDSRKTSIQWIFGIGVNPANAVEEMRFVQKIYGYWNLLHEYKQIIFCFDVGLKLDGNLIIEICYRIGKILQFGDRRQILGAIHGVGTEKIHCHYMVNYVGVDGWLFHQKYSVVYYKAKVNEILTEYGLTPIYYFGN